MKNKGLIIALIVLFTIIVFLLIMFLVACLSGKINFANGIISIGSKNSKVILDKTFELEDIKNIEVKQDAGDIIFKETENDYIQVVVYGNNEDDVNINLSNNALNIDYTHKRNFAFLNFGTTKNDIIIYIPSDYQNEIKLKNDYGVCEITDLENAKVDIDCDAGDVRLGKIKDTTIKCDYGNIEIKEIVNKCDIKANFGNINIDKISIQENSTIKADYGNIEIGETNEIYINADCDLGESNINKNNRDSEIELKINCDLGNITVNN